MGNPNGDFERCHKGDFQGGRPQEQLEVSLMGIPMVTSWELHEVPLSGQGLQGLPRRLPGLPIRRLPMITSWRTAKVPLKRLLWRCSWRPLNVFLWDFLGDFVKYV